MTKKKTQITSDPSARKVRLHEESTRLKVKYVTRSWLRIMIQITWLGNETWCNRQNSGHSFTPIYIESLQATSPSIWPSSILIKVPLTALQIRAHAIHSAVFRIFWFIKHQPYHNNGHHNLVVYKVTRGGVWGWQVGRPHQAPLLRGPRTSGLWVCQAIFSGKLEMLIHAPFKILLQGQIP